jgi:hypothetical protein
MSSDTGKFLKQTTFKKFYEERHVAHKLAESVTFSNIVVLVFSYILHETLHYKDMSGANSRNAISIQNTCTSDNGQFPTKYHFQETAMQS